MTEEVVAPAVRLVRDFVNTYEPQAGDESLGSTDALRNWLAARDLLPSDAAVEDADLAAAVTVREGLRNVLLGHAGHDPDPEAVEALQVSLADVPLRRDFATGGYRLISTRADPVGQALGQLLDAIRQSSQDGTWPRLKVCARDTCRWAFYDASRNQVRRWCSMAGCGNYVKMRARTQRGKGRKQDIAAAQPPQPA